MHLLGTTPLGITIMVLFALQGAFVLFTPGSLRLQKPEGGFVSWLYNGVNLLIILVVTPVVGIALIKNWAAWLTVGQLPIGPGIVRLLVEGVGLASLVLGNLLMYWSRYVLGRSFRLGAVAPRDEDRLIVRGPYGLVRHPMYTAVLAMALGLALVVQSVPILVLFVLLSALVVALIPVEERQLSEAYGQQYTRYQQQVKKLVPGVY